MFGNTEWGNLGKGLGKLVFFFKILFCVLFLNFKIDFLKSMLIRLRLGMNCGNERMNARLFFFLFRVIKIFLLN